MPVYVFRCTDCGRFERQCSMAEVDDDTRCPTCGDSARRVFTPPSLPALSSPLRRALAAEEASSEQPRVVSTKSGRPMPHSSLHRH